MALLGSEPVSAANLAAALGIGSGGGSLPSDFGNRPVSVDNLKSVLEVFGRPDEAVLFLDRAGVESGLLNDDLVNYSEVMYLRYTPFSGEMYLTAFGEVSGGSFYDGVVSINARTFEVQQLNYTVVLIIGKK